MKVIIAGGRDVPEQQAKEYILAAMQEIEWLDEICEIVHGAARGVDSAAGELFQGIYPVTEFPAEWGIHGKAAGPIRNNEMRDYSDALIAIWDGQSRGTAHMIKAATEAGLRVHVYRYEAEKC